MTKKIINTIFICLLFPFVFISMLIYDIIYVLKDNTKEIIPELIEVIKAQWK